MEKRTDRVKKLLRRHRLDGILISNLSNIYYVSGFRGGDSYCLITPSANYIITDFRYLEQAQKEAAGFYIVNQPASLFKKTIALIKKLKLKSVGFESHHLTVKEAQIIGDGVDKRLYPTFQLIEKIRVIKSPDEIKLIKKCASIAKETLRKIIGDISEGDREADIAARTDFLLRKNGADAPAFETIVACGPNSSMPHARPGSRRVKEGEPVMLDFGVRLEGYNSDLTRTHFVGKIDKHFKLIYSIVAAAQKRAISKVAAGIKISEIDRAARDYISGKGFGSYFGHATGHSIGIDVHELPSINSKNHNILREGMVFSVEPGIYIPGSGGIRIEDMVLVTTKGHTVLTR